MTVTQKVTDIDELDPYVIGYWEKVPIPLWLTSGLTVQMWDALPESLCQRIEVVDGRTVYLAPPSADHQGAAGMLAAAVRRGIRACEEPLTVLPLFDLRLNDNPLHHRKPDVIVYRESEDESWPRPQDTVLIVEVVSRSSRVIDTVHKLGEYAEAGVPHYWIVETRNGTISTVTWYALPEDDKRYEVRACWTPAEAPDGIRAEEPFPVRIAWDELAF